MRFISRNRTPGLHVLVRNLIVTSNHMLNEFNNIVIGQDNTNSQCTIGTVPNIFEGRDGDHAGPYDGVFMGC